VVLLLERLTFRLIGRDGCLKLLSVGVVVGQTGIHLRQGQMAQFVSDFLRASLSINTISLTSACSRLLLEAYCKFTADANRVAAGRLGEA
jgi:hypothetical protein